MYIKEKQLIVEPFRDIDLVQPKEENGTDGPDKLLFDAVALQLPEVLDPIMNAVEAITEKCQQCFISMTCNNHDQSQDHYSVLEVKHLLK